MTTATIRDLRRNDLPDSVNGGMYWITSATIDKYCDDLGAVLFSFPITKSVSRGFRQCYVEQVVFQVKTAFVGGTPTMTIASGTLLTDDVTTGGDVTEVDADDYMLSDDITEATAGWYPAGKTGTGSDWVNNKILGDAVVPYYITPLDAVVPCVYVLLTSSAAITAGEGRLHLLINEVPPYGAT